MYEDEAVAPVVIGAIDESVWEHWDETDEARWHKQGRDLWGMPDSDFREVWLVISDADLKTAFETPSVTGRVEAAE